MLAPAAPPIPDVSFALTLSLLLLAPLAIAGLALINAGLGRSRSAAQSMLGCLVLISVAVLVFALVGATFADGAAGSGHVFHLSGKPWNWAGTGPIALSGLVFFTDARPARTAL